MFQLDPSLTSALLRRAYEDLYRQEWLGTRQALFAWLMKRLPLQSGERLLDIACGDAQLCPFVESLGGIYFGVDFAAPALRQSQCRLLNIADGLALPFSNGRFHWVTCIGSLEHFQDMDKGVREIARVLKPDGCAVILVPNAFSLTWNFLHVWRSGHLADNDKQPIQGFATRDAWERLLRDNGLMVFKVVGYERSWPQTRNEWLRYWREPREGLLGLLWPFVPLNLRRCFLFFCRPAKETKPI